MEHYCEMRSVESESELFFLMGSLVKSNISEFYELLLMQSPRVLLNRPFYFYFTNPRSNHTIFFQALKQKNLANLEITQSRNHADKMGGRI